MYAAKSTIGTFGDYHLKAVLIAGGFGTRLRPLSCTRPKHLFPIGGRPLLDWTLERLAKGGVSEVVFAVNYLFEDFVKQYGKSAYGMKLHYCQETRPLGTGGCIKNAERTIGHREPFLVLNGDIISNTDYAKLFAQHLKNGGLATMTLHRVEDPSRYGVAEMAEKNLIKRFVEKPERGKAKTNLVNAGIYILSPKIFDCIPSQRAVSIEREVFPTLAQDQKLFGYEFNGFWIDIGEPSDYLKGNQLLLDEELRNGSIGHSARLEGKVDVKNPVAIGEHTIIGDKSRIGPHVSIGGDVTIGKGVRIENSIIFSGTVVSDFSSLKGAIIGEAAIIGNWVKIEDNCIVGDHAMIHDNVTLTKGVSVCPQKEVAESVLSPKCLM
jgi:mannose-1-phosphate guanylyltransferase